MNVSLFHMCLGVSDHCRQFSDCLLYYLHVSDLKIKIKGPSIPIHTHSTSNFTLESLSKDLYPLLDR